MAEPVKCQDCQHMSRTLVLTEGFNVVSGYYCGLDERLVDVGALRECPDFKRK